MSVDATIRNDEGLDFNAISQQCFDTTPYEWQTSVGNEILKLALSNSPCRYLCIRPTGGGKTLLFTTIARFLRGVTICISPLLSLGADQAPKSKAKYYSSIKNISLSNNL